MTTQSIYRSAQGEKLLMDLYSEVLAAWPVEARELVILTSLGDTFMMASGPPDAPPLILLHGSGSNSAAWAGDVAAYSKKYRVYAVDIPGEAGRSSQQRPGWEIDVFVTWLSEVLDQLQISSASLAGLSMGGWIACGFALAKPERVNKLILICSSGIYKARSAFYLKMLLFSLLGPLGRKKLEKLIFQDQEITEQARRFFELSSRHFIFRAGEPPLFSDEQLASLKIPLLYLGGDQDQLLNTPASAARLKQLLPAAEIKVLPGMGHGLINTAELVLDFLKS